MQRRLYTFFPYTADGAAPMFEAAVLPGDDDAIVHAGRLFAEEPATAEVVIYDGEREVSRARRPSVGLYPPPPGRAGGTACRCPGR